MTDSTIPLSDLGANAGDDGLRRDRWGRLMVVPPEGGEPVGYSRVTTIAKATDEGGGLMPWKATLAVVGTLRRRGIRAGWEALMSAYADPWYGGEDAKAKCKRLVEEAAEAGGATDRRELGTALHAITAQVDRGETPAFLSDEMQADVDAYLAKMAEYGLAIVPGMIETTIVLDGYGVGGTFDRLVTMRGCDLPMIADLKTGADIRYSDGAFAIQLAAYSRGDAIYRQGASPAEDERAPMPDVDQHKGVIIWLPAGEARCELLAVDLDYGWHGFGLSIDVRNFRKRKGAVTPLSQWVPAPAPPALTLLPPVVSQDDATDDAYEAQDEADAEMRDETRAWLQQRIDVVGAHPRARDDLARLWPPGMPTLRSSNEHSRDQLAAIEAVLNTVEGEHAMPFGPDKPRLVTDHEGRVLARLNAVFPGSTIEPA